MKIENSNIYFNNCMAYCPLDGGIRLRHKDGDLSRAVEFAGDAAVSNGVLTVPTSVGGLTIRTEKQPSISEKITVTKITAEIKTNSATTIEQFALQVRLDGNDKTSCSKALRWIPNIKRRPEQVCGQHAFRSPVAIASNGSSAAAIIPNIDEIKRITVWEHYLDLRNDSENPNQAPVLEYGIQKIMPSDHVYYSPDKKGGYAVDKTTMYFSFYLLCFEGCGETETLRTVSDFIWNSFANCYESELLPQTVPFAKYAEYGNNMALSRLWERGPVDGTGGICLVTFTREDGIGRGREYADDLWFHCWFNNMRTAMELAVFGYLDKAFEVARCLVAAPQKSGIFPTIYAPHECGSHEDDFISSDKQNGSWIASSAHGGGKHVYSLPDCAWSAIWLRKFISEHGHVDGAEGFLHNLCKGLLHLQDADGGFPCWVKTDTLEADERLNHSASGALPVWFLGEELLAGAVDADSQSRVRNAVIDGADFIVKKIIPEQKFEDFELYYSCSGKPLDFYDEISGMFAQNTLAMQWCAEALRVAYELTNNKIYLGGGLRCMYILSLYQQCWDNPKLDFYSFGGFGVMNTDGEWNDARQAQFAESYMNYYELTGDFIFLRRAVAATRASFALMVMEENRGVCPRNYAGETGNANILGSSAENYGHGGRNEKSGQSGFHWGTGSALVSAARIKERYGDILLDLGNAQAVGIDGIAVNKLEYIKSSGAGQVVRLDIRKLEAVENFEIRVRGDTGRALRIMIDGYECERVGADRFVCKRINYHV